MAEGSKVACCYATVVHTYAAVSCMACFGLLRRAVAEGSKVACCYATVVHTYAAVSCMACFEVSQPELTPINKASL